MVSKLPGCHHSQGQRIFSSLNPRCFPLESFPTSNKMAEKSNCLSKASRFFSDPVTKLLHKQKKLILASLLEPSVSVAATIQDQDYHKRFSVQMWWIDWTFWQICFCCSRKRLNFVSYLNRVLLSAEGELFCVSSQIQKEISLNS